MTVGRSRELAQLDAGLDAAIAGKGRVVLVEGTSGTGKTALLGELAIRAARAGLDVQNTVHAQIGDGTAIILDDPRLDDPDRIAELARAARLIGQRRAILALSMTTHKLEPAARELVTGLRALPQTERIVLAALSAVACSELIRQSLPSATNEFCHECAELTGGNPFILSELVTWISASRLTAVAGSAAQAVEPVPPRTIREFVHTELAVIGADATALAVALARAERPLTLDEALAATGLERAAGLDAVGRLIESGLVAPGEPLLFRAALTRRCLRAEPPTHPLLLSAPSGDREVVEQLIELADSELADGNPDRATPLIRRALAEDPSEDDARPHLLARLGHVDLLQGRPASVAKLSAAAAGLGTTEERAGALLKLGLAHVSAGALREAAVTFEAAVAADSGGTLAVTAQVAQTLTGILVPETRDQAVAAVASLGESSELDDERLLAAVRLAGAWVSLMEGAPRDAVAEKLSRALTLQPQTPPPAAGYFDAAAAMLCTLIEDFDGAQRLCDAGVAAAREAGSALAERNVELARAQALLHVGNLEQAGRRALALIALENEAHGVGLTAADAILVDVHLERDESELATQIAVAARGPGAIPEPQRPSLLVALARVRLERGQLAEALRAATDAGFACKALGITNPAVVAWQPVAAVCYAQAGDLVRARALAREAHEAAERFGGRRALAVALRARAFVARGPDGLRALERARETIEGSGAELERARVLLDHGRALSAAGRDRAARATLHSGIELADRLGARRLCRIGLGSLRAAGGRPRRSRMSGPDALTPAERRVVELAIGGLTNPEIARELVVTRKTVEWHLSRAYSKLSVSSRRDLPQALARSRDSRLSA